MLCADSLNLVERRRISKERRELIERGDISMALQSMTVLHDEYADMASQFKLWREKINSMKKTIDAWASVVRIDRNSVMKAVGVIDDFNRTACKLLHDSTRVALSEIGDVISKDDVTDVADDVRFAEMLKRISEADALNALKLSRKAYKIACETIGSYTSKMLALRRRKSSDGSTAAEVETAERKALTLERVVETLERRKDAIREINLGISSAIEKFRKNNVIGESRDRALTESEKAALKGLI